MWVAAKKSTKLVISKFVRFFIVRFAPLANLPIEGFHCFNIICYYLPLRAQYPKWCIVSVKNMWSPFIRLCCNHILRFHCFNIICYYLPLRAQYPKWCIVSVKNMWSPFIRLCCNHILSRLLEVLHSKVYY